jgi:hypothetical protein
VAESYLRNLPTERSRLQGPLTGVVLPPLPDPTSNMGQGGQCRAIRIVQAVEALFEPTAREDIARYRENCEPEADSASWLPAENVHPLFFFRRIRMHPPALDIYRQPDRSGPLNNTITFIA